MNDVCFIITARGSFGFVHESGLYLGTLGSNRFQKIEYGIIIAESIIENQIFGFAYD